MAINIIKHGKETFKTVCPTCGCEFTYQIEDLKEDSFSNYYIECPDCDQIIAHKCESKKRVTLDYTIPNLCTHTTGTWPDCETCPNKPDPTKTIIGDTPCSWCKKNQPYCDIYTVNK